MKREIKSPKLKEERENMNILKIFTQRNYDTIAEIAFSEQNGATSEWGDR